MMLLNIVLVNASPPTFLSTSYPPLKTMICGQGGTPEFVIQNPRYDVHGAATFSPSLPSSVSRTERVRGGHFSMKQRPCPVRAACSPPAVLARGASTAGILQGWCVPSRLRAPLAMQPTRDTECTQHGHTWTKESSAGPASLVAKGPGSSGPPAEKMRVCARASRRAHTCPRRM